MTQVVNQDTLMEQMMLTSATINSVDSRGWYICNRTNYLYQDGVIRSGVSSVEAPAFAFWETEQQATDFYNKWKAKGELV